NAFVPDFVTTLMMPPIALPYSADAPSDTSWISSTISGSTTAPPRLKEEMLVSPPSTSILFSSADPPTNDIYMLRPEGSSLVTPGEALIKSKTLLRRVGVSSYSSFEILVDKPDLAVSISAALPTTVRLSDSGPTLSVTGTSIRPPTTTCKFWTLYGK